MGEGIIFFRFWNFPLPQILILESHFFLAGSFARMIGYQDITFILSLIIFILQFQFMCSGGWAYGWSIVALYALSRLLSKIKLFLFNFPELLTTLLTSFILRWISATPANSANNPMTRCSCSPVIMIPVSIVLHLPTLNSFISRTMIPM